MNHTAAEIAEALRPVIREEVRLALAKTHRKDAVTLAEAARQLGVSDTRTVRARLFRAGRDVVPGRGGRPSVRQADLDAMLAPRL